MNETIKKIYIKIVYENAIWFADRLKERLVCIVSDCSFDFDPLTDEEWFLYRHLLNISKNGILRKNE